MYNAEKTILNCLNSIIDQKNILKRIIVVDDCSTDNSCSIVNDYIENNPNINVILLKQKRNKGPGSTRNIGFFHVQTPFVAFVDSDVVLTSNWSSELLKVVINNKKSIAFTGHTEGGYLEHVLELVKINQGPSKNSISSKFLCGDFLCETQTMQMIGGFDENLERGEDLDLSIHSKKLGIQLIFVEGITIKEIQRDYNRLKNLNQLSRKMFLSGRSAASLLFKYHFSWSLFKLHSSLLKSIYFTLLLFLLLLLVFLCSFPLQYIPLFIITVLFISSMYYFEKNFKTKQIRSLLIPLLYMYLIILFLTGLYLEIFKIINNKIFMMNKKSNI